MVMTLSEFECKVFKKLSPNSQVVIVANGTDIPAAIDYRSEGRQGAMFVGSRKMHKGFDVLAQSDHLFFNAGITLTAVTDTLALDGFRGISCTGPVSKLELERLYASSRVCAIPSVYEAFSIVAIEAIAHGTPIVVSDGVRVSDRFVGMPFCRIVKRGPGFARRFFEELKYFASLSPEEFHFVSSEARNTAKKFGWAETTDAMVMAVERLMATNVRQSGASQA